MKTLASYVRSIAEGKRIGNDLYLHLSHPKARGFLAVINSSSLQDLAPLPEANVIKIHLGKDQVSVSGLMYEDFFEEPFPELKWSQKRQLNGKISPVRLESRNPPVLHRKELLLPSDHPRWAEYAKLTSALERAGLLPAPTFIGRRQQWTQFLERRGYRVKSHTLLELVRSNG